MMKTIDYISHCDLNCVFHANYLDDDFEEIDADVDQDEELMEDTSDLGDNDHEMPNVKNHNELDNMEKWKNIKTFILKNTWHAVILARFSVK